MNGRHRLRGWSKRTHRGCGDMDLVSFETGRTVCYSCKRSRWPIRVNDLIHERVIERFGRVFEKAWGSAALPSDHGNLRAS